MHPDASGSATAVASVCVCAGLWEGAAEMQNKYEDSVPPIAVFQK